MNLFLVRMNIRIFNTPLFHFNTYLSEFTYALSAFLYQKARRLHVANMCFPELIIVSALPAINLITLVSNKACVRTIKTTSSNCDFKNYYVTRK